MTYHLTPTRRVRRRGTVRASRGLGSWIDDLFNSAEGNSGTAEDTQVKACLAAANAQTAMLDAKTADMIRNWNPTGYYTPADIRKGVAAVMQLVAKAQSDLDWVASQWNSSQDSLQDAMGHLFDAGAKSLDFLQAANDADASGVDTIEAPGFKRWVTGTMTDVSNAGVTASVVACGIPAWLALLQSWQSGFDAAMSILKAIAGVIKQVGQTVIKVADDLQMFYDILKWGALAGVLYYGYLFVRKKAA